MSRKSLYYLFLFVVVVGVADTLYLSLTTFFDIPPVCGPLHGCETVAASKYSKLLGIPLAYLGVLCYFGNAILSGPLQTSARIRQIALLYTTVGAAFSVWFLYVQAVLINALCVYCLISAAASFVLFLLACMLLQAPDASDLKN